MPPPFFPPPKPPAAAARQWKFSETLAMAREGCVRCGGLGLMHKTRTPCHCVTRAIFRTCFNRFREIEAAPHRSRIWLERICQTRTAWRISYGRKNEEYCADFLLLAKRALTPAQWKLFRLHKLLGADWQLCTRQLQMSRGNFFHEVYRIEQKLGRAFAETEPFALFPLAAYFGSARAA